MNILLLTILVVTISVTNAGSFVYADEPVKKCVPDTTFFYDHNDCKCNSEGNDITCERELFTSVKPVLHWAQLQNLTLECVPNQIFDFSCQKCLCSENGINAICTSTRCTGWDRPIDNPERCVPGSVFNVECNGCICGADGKAACTKLDCSRGNIKKPECVPNESYVYECNSCNCSPEGVPLCERMKCSHDIEFWHEHVLNVTMSCQPESIFDYNCHKCICDDDGNYAICHGKPACTRYDETKETEDRCHPGMVFGHGSNICVCGDHGKGVCTTFTGDITYRFKYLDNIR